MSDISIDGLLASGAPFRVGVVLSKTFSVFGSKFGSFLLLAFIPLIPVLAVTLIGLAGPQQGPPASSAAALGGLSGLLTFVLGIVAQATTLYDAFQQMGGKPFSIAQSLSVGLKRSPIQSATLRAPAILQYAFARCQHVLPAYLTRPGAALTSVHSPRGALRGLGPGREQYA